MRRALFLLPFMLVPFTAQAQTVATVDGTPITKQQILDRLRNVPPQAIAGQTPDQGRQLVLDGLVRESLIDKAAEASKIAATDDFKKRMEAFRINTLRELYLRSRIEKDVNDEKLKKLYDEFVKANKDEREVRASHILLPSEEAAKQVIKELDKGADFAKIAAEKSSDPGTKASGGDLGYFRKGMMVPEFSEAAFAMKPSENTKTPVKSRFGWHVIKVIDNRPAQVPSFDTVKSRLEQEAIGQLVEKQVDELRNKAQINIDSKELSTVPVTQ